MNPQPASSPQPFTGLSPAALHRENRRYAGTLGVSQHNREQGFVPAFRDGASDRVYRSRFADGRPAPFHCLDGLPAGLVARRDADGRVRALKPTVLAGFVRDGCFYTRAQAARCVRP